jgi:hypothetical protein
MKPDNLSCIYSTFLEQIPISILTQLIGLNKFHPKINILALGHNVFYMVVLIPNEAYESPNLTEE